jgi:prolyl oligopeptidase
MKRQIQAVSLLLGLALSVLVSMAAAEGSSPPPKPKPKAAAKPAGPPVTRKDNVTDTINGVEIVDPYRWLEDQQSPETRKWIAAENTYTQSQLGTRPTLTELRARLGGLMRTERMSVPMARDGKYYFSLQRANQDLATICRRASASGETQVLVDPMPMSKDHTTSVGLMDVSRNGARMAYSVRRGGTDEVEIRVRNADAPRDLPDTLKYGLYGSVSLTPDGAGMYYAKRNRDTGGRIYFHEIGTKVANDVEVFGNGFGRDVWVNAQLSDDGRHVLYSADHGWGRSEIYVGGIAPDSKIEPIVTDIDAHFNCTMVGDRILVHTDWKAPKYRLMLADMDQPAPAKWREIVPEGKDVLQDVTYIGGKIYATYLHDVVTEIKTFTLNGEPTGNVPLPGIGSASVSGEPDGKEAFITFTSFTTPPTTFRDDIKTGDRDVWSKPTVDIDPEQFAVEQVWYTSKDSTTRIPMFLVHKKGLEIGTNRPVLLYGYGGFNVAITPAFRATAVAFAERGGVFAVANIRGGSEFGEAWHKAGMLANKQNVFDDFMAAADWLIANHYTTPKRLAIQGGSNGGLLVGACLTQRPELYRAVLCQFPDLDMVRYYQFKNNNPPALLEYGNASDPEQFKYLVAYSPYQNVKDGTAYPAVMLTSGDADTRVPPLQARKMTARLQAATTSKLPVLLRYDTRAGHAGGRPLAKVIDDTAQEMAFLFWQLGMEEEGKTATSP